MSWLGVPKGDEGATGETTGARHRDARQGDTDRFATQQLTVPDGLVRRAIATLDPGYFAWVMATGIISVGTDLLGDHLLSQVVLGVTVAAFVGLVLAYTARLVWFAPFVRQSAADPTTAMAYFTVVAGTDVLAVRLVMATHPLVAFALGTAAAAVWLGLTYALPWSIVAAARRPVLGEINGTWLVWVVATQSLSIVAAATAPSAPATWLRADLPDVAVCLWGLGVMLYLVLIVIIFLRLLLIEVTPAEMGPAYWIAMGATAISVRAAAGIIALHDPHSAVLVAVMRPFMVGLSVVLWAFGTWWIPLLVLLGIWRYLLRRYPRTYEPRLWNVVFPLGMYTVASFSLGRVPGLGFMASIARVWVWVGVAAWVGVLSLMAGALVRTLVERRRPESGCVS
ncbi:MAG: tellurite resistance/C4-dicarboxylate transporter family protein [Actinomycetota bacterium]|nr:tellurite resistance/C4-dicarboxylate transporter family protein [Actinomycetota bacterium]